MAALELAAHAQEAQLAVVQELVRDAHQTVTERLVGLMVAVVLVALVQQEQVVPMDNAPVPLNLLRTLSSDCTILLEQIRELLLWHGALLIPQLLQLGQPNVSGATAHRHLEEIEERTSQLAQDPLELIRPLSFGLTRRPNGIAIPILAVAPAVTTLKSCGQLLQLLDAQFKCAIATVLLDPIHGHL